MADPFADDGDVTARLMRPLSAVEATAVTEFLEYLSALVRTKVPGIDARIADDTDLEVLTRHTVAEATRRALLNPDGWREVAIDDFRRVRDAAVSSGALYLTDGEVADLKPLPGPLGAAFVIPLGG